MSSLISRLLQMCAAAACLLVLSGCAHKPGVGSYLDAATTYAAVESTSLAEGNPLLSGMGSWETAAASIAIKQASKYGLSTFIEPDLAHRAVETGGMFGGGWNTALLLGAGYPVAGVAGVALAIGYWMLSYDSGVAASPQAEKALPAPG